LKLIKHRKVRIDDNHAAFVNCENFKHFMAQDVQSFKKQ